MPNTAIAAPTCGALRSVLVETVPRNVRVPDKIWEPFNKNVGVRGKSIWLRDFMSSVNLDPTLWREFKAVSEIRGDSFSEALLKAIRGYLAGK